jgi:hypothetical protein
MCLICDGYTQDEVLALQAARLEIDQFYVQLVAAPEHRPGYQWGYTVGLIDAAEHPELIVAGAEPEVSWRLLTSLGRAVLEGTRLDVGHRINLGDDPHDVAWVAVVDPVQY